MYIQVKLLHGSHRSLWYKSSHAVSKGSMVQVPVRGTLTPALVVQTNSHAPKTSFDIKQIERIESFPHDEYYVPFLKRLGHYYHLDLLHFIKRIRSFLTIKKRVAARVDLPVHQREKQHTLTDEQAYAAQKIVAALHAQQFKAFVLQGLTGSGKTEVYKAALAECISQGKSALLLLPEVTLALALQNRIAYELPNLPLFGFHSATTAREKYAVWDNLIAHKPIVIVGVHQPPFLPIANLGLIIIDEEHEVGYQEKKHPKINTKEAALLRAHCAQIPIVLGSATPSVQTLYNVDHKKWERLLLKKRFSGTLPEVKVVLLSEKKRVKKRPHFWISCELYDALKQCLAKKEQAIVFMNRRGFSFFVQCKACSYVVTCPSCSVSLTLHEDNSLRCHYCQEQQPIVTCCPECKAPEKNLLKKGIGTQQVVSILEKLFPSARIARADLDTTAKKKEWKTTLDALKNGSLDILVGTQTIAKGFHFPRVTLVGIIWADLNLNFPKYNASETTLQQLIQVAGRAGRACAGSTVIVQAMAEHPIFNHINELTYPDFYPHEIALRQEVGYPPCKRLVEIELKNTNEVTIDREAHDLIGILKAQQRVLDLEALILGPARPPVHKVHNVFSRTIYIKADTVDVPIALYRSVNKNQFSSKLYFTPNPLS